MATAVLQFVSTYAQVIVGQLNLHMDAEALIEHLYKSGNQSFYKRYLQSVSGGKINRLYLAQWHDICEYMEGEISKMVYAVADIESTATNPSPIQIELNALKQQLENHLEDFTTALDQQNRRDEWLQEETIVMQAWDALQTQHADLIIAKLTAQEITLPPAFKERLIQQLLLQGAGVKVPDNILSHLKLPTKSQKALIGAFEDNTALIETLNVVQEELRQIEKENKHFIDTHLENFNLINQENKSATKQLSEKVEHAKIVMATVRQAQTTMPKELQVKFEATKAPILGISTLKIGHQ